MPGSRAGSSSGSTDPKAAAIPQSVGFFVEGLEALDDRPVETRTYVANSAAHVHAEALARRHGGRLHLLTVDVRADNMLGYVGWEPLGPRSPDEVLADGLAAVSPDVAPDGRCLDGGSIPQAIADYCAPGIDLLVVGSRGYGPLGRVFVGSVAGGLLHRAGCPVLAVPRPRNEPE